MTAPNTGAPNVGNAPITPSGTPEQPGVAAQPAGAEPGRVLTDDERRNLPAHAGGFSLADRAAKLEEKYGARFEGTHALDRSSFVAAIVLADGTRIAAQAATNEEAVKALESRLDRIGEALTNA